MDRRDGGRLTFKEHVEEEATNRWRRDVRVGKSRITGQLLPYPNP